MALGSRKWWRMGVKPSLGKEMLIYIFVTPVCDLTTHTFRPLSVNLQKRQFERLKLPFLPLLGSAVASAPWSAPPSHLYVRSSSFCKLVVECRALGCVSQVEQVVVPLGLLCRYNFFFKKGLWLWFRAFGFHTTTAACSSEKKRGGGVVTVVYAIQLDCVFSLTAGWNRKKGQTGNQ